MTRTGTASAFALMGMLLTMALSVPQIALLRRAQAIGSLSGATWELAAASYATWVVYGLVLPIYPQVPGNLLACVGSIAVVAGIARRRRSWVRPLLTWLLVLGVALLVSSRWGAVGLGWVAFVTTITRTVPQIWVLAWRDYAGGVSRGAWSLAAAGSGCWLVYAVLTDDKPVLASTAVGLLTAVAIVVLTAKKKSFARVGDPDQG
jgi:uncharacterized protein with PQ loop repeat